MRVMSLIRVLGLIDLGCIGWVCVSALMLGRIPIYDGMNESIAAARTFGDVPLVVSVFPYLLLGSVLFSGALLVNGAKLGGYLGLVQAPFRCLLVIQPSFFFIIPLLKLFPSPWIQFSIIIFTEIVKSLLLLAWINPGRLMERLSGSSARK